MGASSTLIVTIASVVCWKQSCETISWSLQSALEYLIQFHSRWGWLDRISMLWALSRKPRCQLTYLPDDSIHSGRDHPIFVWLLLLLILLRHDLRLFDWQDWSWACSYSGLCSFSSDCWSVIIVRSWDFVNFLLVNRSSFGLLPIAYFLGGIMPHKSSSSSHPCSFCSDARSCRLSVHYTTACSLDIVLSL